MKEKEVQKFNTSQLQIKVNVQAEFGIAEKEKEELLLQQIMAVNSLQETGKREKLVTFFQLITGPKKNQAAALPAKELG